MKKNSRAFLLLEVVLTITILSVGLVFVIRAISTSMKAVKAAFDYNQAIHLIYNKAFELETDPSFRELSSSFKKEEGTFEDNEDFRWKCLFEKIPDYNLSKVTLTVTWKEGRREGVLDMATFLQTHVSD